MMPFVFRDLDCRVIDLSSAARVRAFLEGVEIPCQILDSTGGSVQVSMPPGKYGQLTYWVDLTGSTLRVDGGYYLSPEEAAAAEQYDDMISEMPDWYFKLRGWGQ